MKLISIGNIVHSIVVRQLCGKWWRQVYGKTMHCIAWWCHTHGALAMVHGTIVVHLLPPWWKQVEARPTEGRTFLPGEASGAFCATAFFKDVYEEQDEDEDDDTIYHTSWQHQNTLKQTRWIFQCLLMGHSFLRRCLGGAGWGWLIQSDNTQPRLSILKGNWPFGWSQWGSRENQWSAILPCGAASSATKCGAASSATKKNQGVFSHTWVWGSSSDSLKSQGPNWQFVEKEKSWGAIMKWKYGWIVLKMGEKFCVALLFWPHLSFESIVEC